MQRPDISAGIAFRDITPPIPIDLVGSSRRHEPADHVNGPLTVTSLVVRSATTTVCVVALDLGFLGGDQADQLRHDVAALLGTSPEAVLLNVSHTHAAPIPHLGMKLGGRQRSRSERELEFIRTLPAQVLGCVADAVATLRPATVRAGSTTVDLTVNRRERTPGGDTVMGWNPDGPIDREVGVMRIADENDRVLAVVVNFACHPVVLGPENLGLGPDFVGPLRETVSALVGAPCLFLQGAGGNILPRESMFADDGPEVPFGRRLGIAAAGVCLDLAAEGAEYDTVEYGSLSPIHLYRRRPHAPGLAPLAFAGRTVELPLRSSPDAGELAAARDRYAAAHAELVAGGAPPAVTNPAEANLAWAEGALAQLSAGGARPVTAFVQVLRIGEVALAAIPGEAFAELGLEIKTASSAARTLVAGYSNGVLSYFPPACEYPFGGYEVDLAHHTYGLVQQVGPGSAGLMVRALLEMIEDLFPGDEQ